MFCASLNGISFPWQNSDGLIQNKACYSLMPLFKPSGNSCTWCLTRILGNRFRPPLKKGDVDIANAYEVLPWWLLFGRQIGNQCDPRPKRLAQHHGNHQVSRLLGSMDCWDFRCSLLDCLKLRSTLSVEESLKQLKSKRSHPNLILIGNFFHACLPRIRFCWYWIISLSFLMLLFSK